MSLKENISLWPGFSLDISCSIRGNEDDLIAALEHPDCVRSIWLYMGSKVDKVLGMLQVPFPVLTRLYLLGSSSEDVVLDLSDQFLGAAAPSLQDLSLGNISFLALSTLFC